MPSLDGRVAVITGASRRAGIGFAIARRLRADGATVFLHSYRPHDAAQPWGAEAGGTESLVDELGAAGHLEMDLGDPSAPQALVDTARERTGHIDILVANHARSGRGTLDELTADELDAYWAVNVRATLLLASAFAA